MKLYAIWDKISENYQAFQAESNDTCAVRSFLPISRMIPLKDMEIRQIGEINNGKITLLKDFKIIDWSTYELPLNDAEAKAPLTKKE